MDVQKFMSQKWGFSADGKFAVCLLWPRNGNIPYMACSLYEGEDVIAAYEAGGIEKAKEVKGFEVYDNTSGRMIYPAHCWIALPAME